MATRPSMARTVQSPTFDPGLPKGVGVDIPAEAAPTVCNAETGADMQGILAWLSAIRVAGLLDDQVAIGLLHGMVSIAVEHDSRHGLRSAAALAYGRLAKIAQASDAAAPPFHGQQSRRDIVRAAVRQARVSANAAPADRPATKMRCGSTPCLSATSRVMPAISEGSPSPGN